MTPPKSHSNYKAEWGLDPGPLTSWVCAFSARFIIKVFINILEKRGWWDIAGAKRSRQMQGERDVHSERPRITPVVTRDQR